jgi:hypothetical protein
MFGMRRPGSSASIVDTPELLEDVARRIVMHVAVAGHSCGNEPMSQEPCTLFWPRSGFTPTPGRPILPVAIARLAMAITVVEPWLCSVTPRP